MGLLYKTTNLKCSCENAVYLFPRVICSQRYTEDFRSRFNNSRSAPWNILKRKRVKQELFNAHFAEFNHNDEDDWEARLIDQTDNVDDLRKKIFLLTWAEYSVKWIEWAWIGSFLIFNLNSFFVILTHNIYCNREQWHIHLYFNLTDFTIFIFLLYLCFH